MSDAQPCILLTLTDGRQSRPMARFLDHLGVPYAIFGRDRMVLIPCQDGASSCALLDAMPFRLAKFVASGQRHPNFKALLWRRVRGVSPYDSYGYILNRGMSQGAMVSRSLLDMTTGIHGGVFLA